MTIRVLARSRRGGRGGAVSATVAVLTAVTRVAGEDPVWSIALSPDGGR